MRGLHWGEDDGEPNAPLTADILNPIAVNRFIELTHEAYYRELKEYFGNTIIGFFTDEPSILGRNVSGMFPWTHDFATAFTAAGGDITGLTVRGVNLFIPHAFYYSIEGERKGERPPDVGPNSIWWPHYEKWAEYWSRLSCLMTEIDLHAEVAVLCRNRDLHPELVRPLFEHQTGFQYLPESIWAECEEKDGALYYRGHRYTAVVDAENHFPGVPRYDATAFAPDCLCSPAQPKLRCAHFVKDGTACWFLVNEGNETIHTTLTLPTEQKVGVYDLWNNTVVRQPATQAENGAAIDLHLSVCGSVLLFACTEEAYEILPGPRSTYALPCPAFTLTDTDPSAARKTYLAHIQISAEELNSPSLTLTVTAEEMAELSVNGKSAGACFWAPQSFELQGLLHEGENELILTVTGNMANLYGKQPVEYGLHL